MRDLGFEESFFSGYTIIPNDLIRMRKDGEINRAEFEVLHLVFAFKHFHKHKTSATQMAMLIGDIRPQTVSGVLKSLEEKKIIRSEKIDYHYTRYHLLLEEVTQVRKVDDSTFYFDSSKKEVVSQETSLQNNEKEVMALETRHHGSRDTISCLQGHDIVSLETPIELNRNKKNKKELKEKEQNATSSLTLPSPVFVMNLFNAHREKAKCNTIPSVTVLSKSRITAIKNISSKLSLTEDKWGELFTKAFSSDFLKGQNDRNWRMTFDWMLNEKNCIKIIDGNYSNNNATRKSKFEIEQEERDRRLRESGWFDRE